MEKKSLLLTLLSALLMVVGVPTVSAYLSPCEVFGDCDTTENPDAPHSAAPVNNFDPTNPTTHDAPSLQRDAENAVAQQQLESQLRRDAAYAALSSSASEDDAVAAEDTSPSLGILTENNDQEEYELRMARMEEMDKDGVTIFINGDGSVAQNGTVLHSGAPRTAGTGPETVLMLMLLILAGVSTVAFVHIRNKRLA